jgi:hypothetical protein
LKDSLTEDDLPIPDKFLAVYAETKAYGEIKVHKACCDDLLTISVAPHQIYGPYDRLFLQKLLETSGNGRLRIFGKGGWKISLCYSMWTIITVTDSCVARMLCTRTVRHSPSFTSSRTTYLLDCRDIVNANMRLRHWNAIALCVLTVLHVWSILFPWMFHGWSAQAVPGKFEFPLSERPPKGFNDANNETKTTTLEVDDVWRLVEMTVLPGILAPLSVCWLSTRWHIGMPLHQFITVMYFVDMVRRHTHPHSWALNTPIFFLWL